MIETLEGRRLFAVQAPFLGSPFAVGTTPVVIQAEDFDTGGQGVAYHDTSAANTGGAYRTGEAVDLKPIGTSTTAFRTSEAVVGEWTEYTVDVSTDGTYELEFRVSHQNAGSAFHAEVDGTNVTGSLIVPDTDNYNTFTSVKKSVPLTAGTHVLRLAHDAKASNGYGAAFDWVKVSHVGDEPPPPPPPPLQEQSPYKGAPFAVGSAPVTIQAEDYDFVGKGVAYNDTSASNSGGAYRTSEAVDIKSHATGQYRISEAKAGEWLEYTIDVSESGPYEFEYRVSHQNANSRFHAEIDGVNVTGSLTVPDTNSFNTFVSVKKTVSLAAGQHILRFTCDAVASDGNGAGFDWVRISRVSTTLPAAPSGASATALSPTQVRVNWGDASSIESGFRIERSDNGGAWTHVAEVGPDVESWTNTTQAGRTYLYRVRAYNGAGESPASDAAVAVTPRGAGWTPLFNGSNLSGWDAYLPTTGLVTDPDVSPSGTFSVHDGMLHILNIPSTDATVPFGYLATENSHDTYHLVLEYKWGTKRFAPREATVRDSGLLFHMEDSEGIWPTGMEVQVQEGDTGDVWMLDGAAATATVASTTNSIKQFKEGGTPYRFAGGGDAYTRLKRSTAADTLTGWNKVELYVTGDEAAVIVNGKLVNRVYDMRRPDGDGGWDGLLGGRLGLQAEGAEVFYRNVQIRPLDFDAAPTSATKLFSGGSAAAWRSVNDGGAIDWDVSNGELVVDPGTGDIRTDDVYRDFKLHVEFSVPYVSTTVEQDRGNSGIYLQGRYEVQVLDSFNRTLADANDLGAIYGVRNAGTNAALPAELWQSYDITFTAARWSDGEKVSDARVTVVLNGVTIHNNVAIPTSTAFGDAEGSGDGPIVLQDHGNRVRYRNIWIEPV